MRPYMSTPSVLSMTAFARAVRRAQDGDIVCEIRSVNHRYLDCGVRLPEGLGALEMPVRERLASRLRRGKVDCHVSVRHAAGGAGLHLDHDLADAVAQAAAALASRHPQLVAMTVGDVLRWPGVAASSGSAGYEEPVLGAVDEAIEVLVAQRGREGERLRAFLEARLVELESLLQRLCSATAEAPALLRARLAARLAEWDASVHEARLEQELVLQVQRADVSEELERLAVHTEEARRALAGAGPRGRQLDFLMQELNREATTLAAKSSSAAVTTLTVSLRVLIEQMREQVQNLE